MEPECLQSVLQEAGIQVEMKDLQNPTENFMTHVIIEYLNKFNFHGNEIIKATPEEVKCFSHPDLAVEAIKVINLYSSLSSICNKIFLNEFCLTDISNPGPKKAIRQIKVLFNFYAYARNKMIEYEGMFRKINNRKKEIDNVVEMRDSIMIKTEAIIDERENCSESKKQLKQKISNSCVEFDQNKQISRALEDQIKEVSLMHQKALEKFNDQKKKTLELHRTIKDLQAQVVESPEKYKLQTKELQSILKTEKDERQELNDSITQKKNQIKLNELCQELVKSLHDKSLHIRKIIFELKETVSQIDAIKKRVAEIKNEIVFLEQEQSNTNDLTNVGEDTSQQLFLNLNKLYSEKLMEYERQKIMLHDLQIDLENKKSVFENESKLTSDIANKISTFLQKCLLQFQNELSQECDIREQIHAVIN